MREALLQRVTTDRLVQRPARSPDYAAENRALTELVHALDAAPETVFQKLVDTALSLCDAGTAGLSLIDEDETGPVFRWPALAGKHSEFVGSTMPRHVSPCAIVVDERAPQLFSHLERVYPELCASAPMIEVLLLPFYEKDEPIGTLWVIATDERRKFDREDVRILTNLSAVAASAVRAGAMSTRLREANKALEDRVAERTTVAERLASQLRALATQLAHAEQKERRRLAHILHDDLQQLLVAAQMKLSLAKGHIHSEAALQGVSDAADLIRKSLNASRTLTTELSPPILHERDVSVSLDWLSDQMRQRHGLSVAVDAKGCAELASDALRVVLFEAVRELLFNIVKHAKVNKAKVMCSIDTDQHLVIEVHDEGVGFHPSPRSESKSGFGMLSIRERLAHFRGEMRVTSEPGRGTRTTLRVPVDS
jgi:signal transduction histidine kinase